MKFQTHPSEEEWEEYAYGRTQEARVEKLEEHLYACSECMETLDRAESFIQMMRSAAPDIRTRKSFLPEWLGSRANFRVWTAAFAVAFTFLCISLAARWHPGSAPAGPVAYVALASLRGENSSTAPAHRPLELQLSEPDGSYRIGIFDSRGGEIWKAQAQSTHGRMAATVPAGLSQGLYWVRLFDRNSELVQEYKLQVQ